MVQISLQNFRGKEVFLEGSMEPPPPPALVTDEGESTLVTQVLMK